MRYGQFLVVVVGLGGLAWLGLEGGIGGLTLALLAAVGWLALSRRADAARIAALEDRAAALEWLLKQGPDPVPTLTLPADPEPAPPLESPRLGESPADPGEPLSEAERAEPARRARRPGRPERAPRRNPLDDLPEPVRRAWAFATGGNVIARVGVVVLFVAVGLGIQYAVESGWLGVGVRLGASAAVGAALVALGWRLRAGTPGFGFTLQGGGVGVLYLTVYAAYALYGVLPSLPAIALMAGVAVLCGGLALAQDAPGLAVLGVAGGFAAPVLAGTPEGNHVLLLSYYALLNIGVLGVAWARGWRSVSVVGFLSTFVTGGLWGGLAYRPGLYASVQPFVVLSFAVYLALAVRFALRSARSLGEARTPERAVVVDGALVFGLPAATFVIQAGIVEGVVPYGRAWSAVVLAAVYLVGAVVLRRRAGVRLLADAFLAIGPTFATLALPLAFERVVFGAMWVLEGAGLVWVGARQRKRWMRLGGLALQSVAAVVLFAEGVLSPSDTFTAESLTGWIVALGLGVSAYVLRGIGAGSTEPPAWSLRPYGSLDAPTEVGRAGRDTSRLGPAFERAAGRVLLGFALFWWTTTAAVHVLDLAPERHILAAMLAAAAASGAVFLGLGRVLDWSGLRAAAFGVVPAALVLWLIAMVESVAPLAGWRPAGWAAVAAVAAAALAVERTHRLRPAAFVGAVWVGAGVLAWAVAWGVHRVMVDAWPWGAVGAVLVAVLALTARTPSAVASERERRTAAGGLLVASAVWVMGSWSVFPSAQPLPSLPLFNPLALPALGVLLLIAALRRGSAGAARRGLTVLLSGLGLGALTVETLRGAWAAGAAPWSADLLWASSSAQAALAVAWTGLALVLALVAVRRESRALWFFAAAVLAIVVAKLFLVDLAQTEALGRIVAFLVVGGLMLLIGYLAPLPPAHPAEPAVEADRTEPSTGGGEGE